MLQSGKKMPKELLYEEKVVDEQGVAKIVP